MALKNDADGKRPPMYQADLSFRCDSPAHAEFVFQLMAEAFCNDAHIEMGPCTLLGPTVTERGRYFNPTISTLRPEDLSDIIHGEDFDLTSKER